MTCQIMLATSYDAVSHEIREFTMHVDDVAGSVCQTLAGGTS